jgi:hypothetical protein
VIRRSTGWRSTGSATVDGFCVPFMTMEIGLEFNLQYRAPGAIAYDSDDGLRGGDCR